MTIVFKNNAYSTIAAGIGPSATGITVKSGDGALFPSPGAGEWFPVTLVNQSGAIEICKCTGRTLDTLTVERAQEGTSALSWNANDRIELRITAAVLASFGQVSGVGVFAFTGMRVGYVGAAAPAGWVMASGRTIGSATSGATERANADTEALYTLLWDSYGNTELPIQDSAGSPTTRGVSAAADFAANKRLPLPDYRGRVAAGKDDMGGTSANRLTAAGGGIDGDVMGKAGGSETHTLTTDEIPAHTHNIDQVGTGAAGSGAGGALMSDTYTAGTGAVITDTGGGDPHANVQPTIVENVIIKL